jgi:nitroreductase
METYEAIVSRKSVRQYQPRRVEADKILSLIECARRAPSGGNTQPWNFILVQNEDRKKEIAAVCQQEWMVQAPLFLVCVADIRARIKEQPLDLTEISPQLELKQIIRDTAIAVEHIVLQAESIGLATCWVAHFQQMDLRPVLAIPADKYVIAVLTVGYAAEKPEPKPRRSLQEIIFHERWGNRKEPSAT